MDFLGVDLKNSSNVSAFASGGVQSGQAEVDFGAASSFASVTVSASWVLNTSIITVSPAGVTTSDHDPDDYGLDQLSCYVTNIVAGVGFDLVAITPYETFGKYKLNWIGA